MEESQSLYEKVAKQIAEKKEQIHRKFRTKTAPIQKEMNKLEGKIAPFRGEMALKLHELEREKKSLFAKEFKELCGERYEAFSKFLKKVRGIQLKEYANYFDKEEKARMKKASAEEYIFDLYEGGDNWIEDFLPAVAETLPPKEQKEVVFILWKLEHCA